MFESTGIRLRIDSNVYLLKRPSFLAARCFRRLPFSVANSWRYVLKTKTFSRDGCFRRLKSIAGNSSLTLGRIRARGEGGGGWLPHPLRVFLSFFLDEHQHLTFSVAVRLSIARILRQV